MSVELVLGSVAVACAVAAVGLSIWKLAGAMADAESEMNQRMRRERESRWTCNRCGGTMGWGEVIVPTASAGEPDFPGGDGVVTINLNGPGALVSCRKCQDCGWSVVDGD